MNQVSPCFVVENFNRNFSCRFVYESNIIWKMNYLFSSSIIYLVLQNCHVLVNRLEVRDVYNLGYFHLDPFL
jgi:hypothetical protein